MYILLVFLALGSVSTHDINVGSSTDGKKIFDEHFQASPAVWRQSQNVTINTTDDEVISRIVVTDLREDKAGDAKIVDGGEGQKKVTIELKSPTLLRGYDFNVEVYAKPNKEYENGPAHPSDFKNNAGSLKTPYPGSQTGPQSNGDFTTKLPETPKTQSNPINSDTKQTSVRDTRDTEAKRPEENSPKIESPTIFGQKSATTAKPVLKSSNVPNPNREYSQDNNDDENSTKSPASQTNKDEVRRVRDTSEGDSAAKSPPQGSFDSKTTTTTNKTPGNNFNRNYPVTSHPVSIASEGRDLRATQKDDGENVSPTLVSKQSNPGVYTPNFERNVPSLISSAGADKGILLDNQSKSQNDHNRNVRDTHTEEKEINIPKIDSLANPAANKNAANVTRDEERKTRSPQEETKITLLRLDIEEEQPTTTVSTIFADEDDETSVGGSHKQSSLNPPGVLTKSQKYPVPYPYEATAKTGSTTQTPFKRDTESQTDKDVKLNPKAFGNSETKVSSTTKSPVKRDTESSEKSKPDDKNLKLNPKEFGSFETSTRYASTTKYPVKRDTSEEAKADDNNPKVNPKSVGTFDTKTNIASTTKSPHKRDTESSEQSKNDDEAFKVSPKTIGNQNSTSYDQKIPVVSLQ